VTGHYESRLGIDFGTTHTVAAVTGADGRGQPLLFDASFLLPSAIYAESDGRLLVGRDAERSARLDPTRFEPNPKRRIDDGSVFLGTREHPVAELMSAVLRRVGDEAARVAGSLPASTVLTYPATWASSRRAILADAAARAGLPALTLVPEPIAAAVYFTTVLGHAVPGGGVLVVYDFGGGTFDTSVLRRRPDGGWDVVASDGLPDVGGIDLDAAIVDHLHRSLGARDPERWQRLAHPQDDVARRRHRMLHDDVRSAKEQLSRSSSAAVHVPLFDTDAHLTREEFEHIARPYLDRTVDLTAGTLQRAGVRPDQVNGLFLVGGSSRIPLVSTLLHHRLGVAPTLIEQPELVVALGSLLAAPPPGARPAGVARVSAPPAAPVSGFPPAAPVSGYPPAAPVSAGPSGPISGATWAPPPSMPVSAPPDPVSGPGGMPAPAGMPAHAGMPAPPSGAGRRRARRSRAPLIAAIVALVVLLGGGGAWATWQLTRDDNDGKDNAGQQTTDGPGSGQDVSGAKAGARQQTIEVNKSAWYTGFKLTFGKLTYDADKTSGQLTAEVLLENGGYRALAARLPIVFSVGDLQEEAGFTDSTDASLQAGTKRTVTYEFDLDEFTGTLADGVFLVGRSDENRAVVPVRNKEQLVAMEPRQVVKDVTVTFRDLVIRFQFCEVRGGYPYDYGQAKKDNLMLYCMVDLKYTGDYRAGHYIGTDIIRLGLPDGSEVGPTLGPNEISKPAENVPNVPISFQIRTPVEGNYQLRIVDVHAGEQRGPQFVRDTPFTI